MVAPAPVRAPIARAYSRHSIRRVIYIVDYPFNARDHARFGIDTLEAHGFNVEVWDLSSLLQPELQATSEPQSHLTPSQLRQLRSRQQVVRAIAGLTNSCFVLCLPGYRLQTSFLYRALSRSEARYGLMANIAIPVFRPLEALTVSYFWSKVTGMTLRRFVEWVFPRLPCVLSGVRPADAILVSSAGEPRGLPIGRQTDLVRLHSFDYDTYLRVNKTVEETDSSMAVFLDQFIPFHMDWIDDDAGPMITADEYYPVLCRFFDYIEREANIRVTIAAHPRSDYDKRPDCFNGRRVIKNATADLVRRARLVITESSQSIGFAVLFRKPLLIITRDAYESSTQPVAVQYRGQIHLMAQYLSRVPLNIERLEPIDWNHILSIDEVAYGRFQDHYLKPPGTPQDYYWNIVANYLRSLQ
jgi:hypothetical protein